jgi:hypothetical protein
VKALAIAALLVLTAIAQVTVAPLFPIAGAVADLPLVALLVLTAYAGPTPVMAGLPFVAICTGFASDRAPGLLVLGYLPLLPLAVGIEGWRVPLGQFLRLVLVGVATGMWLRGVLALSSVAQGADPAFGALIGDVLIPGAFLDVALLAVAYFPLRLIGWSGRGMTLQRGGY